MSRSRITLHDVIILTIYLGITALICAGFSYGVLALVLGF